MQEVFDSFQIDFNNLYSITDNKTKKRINTYIEEWQEKGLLKGYFGTLAKNIYNRSRVKNNEVLELFIYGAYIEEQSKLEDKELNIIKEDVNYYYQEGQAEVNRTLPKSKQKTSIIEDALFLYLLSLPNSKGYVWNQYIEAILKYNADQIYRQAVIDIQQQKELDISNEIYQSIIKRQQNQRLNINGDKISGDIDLTLIGINNQAIVEGIKSIDNDAKVVFLANIDGKETAMCHSLNRQEFCIDKENEFNRYYGETQNDLSIRKVKCFGLVQGINLPPINHHFHWCRSTVQYLPPRVEKDVKIKYNELEIPKIIKEIANKQNQTIHERAKKYIDKITNINDYIFDNNYNRIPIAYSPSKDRIIVNPKHDDFKYYVIDETVSHEAVHLYDVRNKITENNINKLRTYIDKAKNYINNNMAYYGRIVAHNEENSSLCDLINILSNGRIRNGAFAHSEDYIKNEINCFRELSSTIISCDLAENKVVNDLVNYIIPLKDFKEEIFKLWDVTE